MQTMQTLQPGFRNLPVDIAFARRSARYLAAQGYAPSHIHSVLVDELEISDADADLAMSALAMSAVAA